MKRALAPALLAALALGGLALPAAGEGRAVRGGNITVGRGAAGIRLGMSRSRVVARLSRPSYENTFGYMEYGPSSFTGFDVYLDTSLAGKPVRMIGVAGPRFHIGRIRVFARGGLRRLARRYGRRLEAITLAETGDRIYRIEGRYRGRQTWTDFSIDKPRHTLGARVLQVFILFP